MAKPRLITDLPTEVLDIIFDLLVMPHTKVYVEGIEMSTERLGPIRQLSLVCRRFYIVLLPRLYVFCFMQFGAVLGKRFVSLSHMYTPKPLKAAGRLEISCIETKKVGLVCWRYEEFVRDLFIICKSQDPACSDARFLFPWSNCDLSFDPKYRKDGILGKNLDLLLPKFTQLRKLTISRYHDLHLSDFLSAIGLVLTHCLTLRDLDIFAEYDFRDSHVDGDVWGDIKDYNVDIPHAPLQTLTIYILGRFKNCGLSDRVYLWPLVALSKVLEVPSRTVPEVMLGFSSRHEWITDKDRSVPRIPKCESGGYDRSDITWRNQWDSSSGQKIKWRLPQVKRLSLRLYHGTLWALLWNGWIDIGLEGLEELELFGMFYELMACNHEHDGDMFEKNAVSFFSQFPNLKRIRLSNMGILRWLRMIFDLKGKSKFKSLKNIIIEIHPSTEFGLVPHIRHEFGRDPDKWKYFLENPGYEIRPPMIKEIRRFWDPKPVTPCNEGYLAFILELL
ncbi:hypothetical protein TWF481_006915 [Arthrobotrys musiformis]|uniref:F-box domain-containing protein n=1 Tax=Arthrobotrys musiformis TaxID=47236 RepID=A0AAV9W9W9_9PEZI